MLIFNIVLDQDLAGALEVEDIFVGVPAIGMYLVVPALGMLVMLVEDDLGEVQLGGMVFLEEGFKLMLELPVNDGGNLNFELDFVLLGLGVRP